ncbi:MAG: PilZ domain-containing protein [Sphingomonas sp. 28-66-16]|nr:MAG: PilZ domain-containing protein [Sphingomonas sp. 28-66-16]
MDQFSHDSMNFADEDPAAQRNDLRDSLFLVAQFRIAGSRESEQVRVRNLSAGGLMAEVAGRIDQGTAVEIEVRGIGWVAGRIAWATAGRVGIAFDEVIDPILARKPVGNGTKTPTFTKPILPLR